MKKIGMIIAFACSCFTIVSLTRSAAISKTLESIKTVFKDESVILQNENEQNYLLLKNSNRLAKEAESYEEEEGEIDNEVLAEALEQFKVEIHNYIDITGLNVENKELINLPDFDPNYIPPTFGEVIYDVKVDMEARFDVVEYQQYQDIIRKSSAVDKFVSLAEVKYENLNPALNYQMHELMPRRALDASALQSLNSILSSFSQEIVVAFGAAIALLKAAIGSSWFPYVAAALIVAAIILIAVIIITHWDEICEKFPVLKEWTQNTFPNNADVFNEYFNETQVLVQESTIARTETIGGETFAFNEVKTRDVAAIAKLTREARWTENVYLMMYIKEESFLVAMDKPVSEAFCVANGTHRNGYSSYTWYQNTARRLIVYAGSGVTTAKPEIDSLNDPGLIFLKHFHNCYKVGTKILRIEYNNVLHWTHSFFGQMFYYPEGSNKPVVHPQSPNPVPGSN